MVGSHISMGVALTRLCTWPGPRPRPTCTHPNEESSFLSRGLEVLALGIFAPAAPAIQSFIKVFPA